MLKDLSSIHDGFRSYFSGSGEHPNAHAHEITSGVRGPVVDLGCPEVDLDGGLIMGRLVLSDLGRRVLKLERKETISIGILIKYLN